MHENRRNMKYILHGLYIYYTSQSQSQVIAQQIYTSIVSEYVTRDKHMVSWSCDNLICCVPRKRLSK